MIEKNRLLSLTDAIIAVASTIMVLKLNIPEHASLAAAKEQLPVLIAYIISFMRILLDWHEHHDTFIRAEKINHRIFLMNCVWLLSVTLIPYVTGMVGNDTTHAASLFLYIGVLCVEQLVLVAEEHMVVRLNHIEIQDSKVIHNARIITLVSYAVAAVMAMIISWLALPVILLGCAVNIVIICVYDRNISRQS